MGANFARLDDASVDQLYEALSKRLKGMCKTGKIDTIDEQTLRCILRYYQERHDLTFQGEIKSMSKGELCKHVRQVLMPKPKFKPLNVEYFTEKGRFLFGFTSHRPRQLTTGQLYRRIATHLTQESGKGVSTFDLKILTDKGQLLPEEEEILLVPSPWFATLQDLRENNRFTVGRK